MNLPTIIVAALTLVNIVAFAAYGMRVFHHKTKHWKFNILMPLFLVLQFALAVWPICCSGA